MLYLKAAGMGVGTAIGAVTIPLPFELLLLVGFIAGFAWTVWCG